MLGFEKKIRIFLTIKETANQATAWWLTLKLSPQQVGESCWSELAALTFFRAAPPSGQISPREDSSLYSAEGTE